MSLQIIPAIDIIDTQLVRLYQGQYDQVTTYANTPLDMAKQYQDMGLNHIHIVDLNGAKDGTLVNLKTIEAISRIPNISIQVGGGIRTKEHIQRLLDIGVKGLIVGSMFVDQFKKASEYVQLFPNQIIAGLDVYNNCLATHGWTDHSSIQINEFLNQLNALPIQSIVTTDIQKDGTFNGPNIQLYQNMAKHTKHPIIASGGVSSIQDLYQLEDAAIAPLKGCIVGKAMIEGKITQQELMAFYE